MEKAFANLSQNLKLDMPDVRRWEQLDCGYWVLLEKRLENTKLGDSVVLTVCHPEKENMAINHISVRCPSTMEGKIMACRKKPRTLSYIKCEGKKNISGGETINAGFAGLNVEIEVDIDEYVCFDVCGM